MTSPAQILLIGLGWFPTTRGMDRYGYELMQQLAAAGDRIDLCGVGLPAISPAPEIALMNLANPKTSLLKRLWHVRQHYRHYRSPDASDLHFSLYSWPLLSDLPASGSPLLSLDSAPPKFRGF